MASCSTDSSRFEAIPGPSREIYCEDSSEENFEFEHASCFICNGYYGPCFEEPVCATCHTFLFPEELGSAQDIPVFSDKTDDGDSGNDEPTDLFSGPERRSSNQGGAPQPAPPTTPPPRSDPVANRLELLTTPREPDNCSPHIVECLPPEVLLAVFSYLDDISLWCVGHVCKRWRQVLQSYKTAESWHTYTLRRWPLYKPIYNIQDWFTVYTQLIDSCPCKTCLVQMSQQLQPVGEENSWRRHRLRNELKSLKIDPPEGIEALPLDSKSCHWMATITGPVGSPYEGGVFYLYLQVPYSYPMKPPTVRFITRIFHPNVSRHGDVGIDCIQHNWTLALTISKVLISIQSLLTDPFCQICMEPAVGRMYRNDRSHFEAIARVWTWRYAMHDVLPPCTNYL
uniref:E2 ubiquitin-conjugating enzyme n=2 Tax=Graphocephala atropunctata TaxID=36148 RepID=A0A1B6LGA5_9HEMI